jgi:MFS family permease
LNNASDASAAPLPPTSNHPLRLLRQVLAAPQRYTRPWYFAYLLLGIVTAGMVPVLLPLMMVSVSHQLSSVAYVMGVYDLGLLTSPLWGVLAERHKLYRSLFLGGFLLAAVAIAVFPFMRSLSGWMLAAFALGAGSSGASTIASLLIVDFEPANEWNPRIGILQSFNGAGQVLGLLLAGGFSHGSFSAGLWLAAIFLLPALVLGKVGLPLASLSPHETGKRAHRHHLIDVRALAVFPRINLPSGIGFHLHALNMGGLRRLPFILGTPFGRFLLSWFMLALGVAGFFTYFPLMLAHSYALDSHLSSLVYALAAAVGIALFVLASRWSTQFGAGRVYRFGLWLRLVGFLLLVLAFLVPLSDRIAFAVIGFALIVVAWPILSVSGTALAAQLASFSEGAAMGLFNAALALATVIGAFASGPLMTAFGFWSIAVMGLIGIGFAIVLATDTVPSRTQD